MAGQPIAADTPPEIESLQRDIWRGMTPEAKGRIVTGLCQGVREAALAGIRRRYPGAFPEAATLLAEAPSS